MRAEDIYSFYKDYLTVNGAPQSKPYLQPLRAKGKGAQLLNKNLAGSYAPSSIREGKALSKVIKLVDQPSTEQTGGQVGYLLVENHADKVLSEMLAGNRILGASLAAFLFRDRQLTLGNGLPDGLIDALREFFHITEEDEGGDYIFDTLFEDDTDNFSESDFKKV